jgi:hypothetical protein
MAVIEMKSEGEENNEIENQLFVWGSSKNW